jgi:hypothetical protein
MCSNEDIRNGIHTMLEEKAAGRSGISYWQMAQELNAHLGTSIKSNTLRRHVASCEHELWTKIRERDGTG